MVFLDADGVLSRCFGDSLNVSGIAVKIVHSGPEVDKIRQENLLKLSFRPAYLFVFTQERYKGFTGFRIYYPNSNGDVYWRFIEKKKVFMLNQTSEGYF